MKFAYIGIPGGLYFSRKEMARQSHFQSAYGFAGLSRRYSNLELLKELIEQVDGLEIFDSIE